MKRLIWVVAAVLVAVGGWAVAANASPVAQYRVATATTGEVTQTVTVTGTVNHVNRADVSFGTDGTVATLTVAPGATVTAGEELGTLDTAALEAAVSRAAAEVTAAEAALAENETAQEEAAGASDELAARQQEVKAAQSTASRALSAASSAFEAQAAACATPSSAECTAAVTTTRSAQEAVQRAQAALQAAIDALAGTVPTQPESANAVADSQASVEEATARLVEAEQALSGATLVAPITGTVGAVASSVGAAVAAGSPVVTVIGEGAAEVTATVPLAQLEKLAAGQEATVTPVGTTEEARGTVTSLGTLPSETSETTAYPVTITVPSPPASLAAGSSATAVVTVATAKEVLTVPTSAVRGGVVTVLSGGETSSVRVTVGAVGSSRSEIKDGLVEGDQVVLADLNSPLPANDQQTGPGGGFVGGNGGSVRMMRPAG